MVKDCLGWYDLIVPKGEGLPELLSVGVQWGEPVARSLQAEVDLFPRQGKEHLGALQGWAYLPRLHFSRSTQGMVVAATAGDQPLSSRHLRQGFHLGG